jgi:putative ABC transport system permease protein
VLSILVAFLLFGFLCAIKEAFTAGVTLAGVDRLIVRHKVSLIQPLPMSYEQRIMNVPASRRRRRSRGSASSIKIRKTSSPQCPVEPEKVPRDVSGVLLPAPQKGGMAETRNGAIVGRCWRSASMEDR